MMEMKQIDLNACRNAAEVASLIGRNGKLSLVVLDKANVGQFKYHQTYQFGKEETFSNAVMAAATEIIKSAINQGKNLMLHTMANATIAYRGYRKYAKLGMDAEAILSRMVDNQYYTPTDEDSAETIALKKASYEAIKGFVEVLADADARGLYVELRAASEFNQIQLVVPEGVQLQAGQIISFVDGTTKDGITAVGWPHFNRSFAKVNEKFVGGERHFYINQKSDNRLSLIDKALKAFFQMQWAECPAATVEVAQLDEETPEGVSMF